MQKSALRFYIKITNAVSKSAQSFFIYVSDGTSVVCSLSQWHFSDRLSSILLCFYTVHDKFTDYFIERQSYISHSTSVFTSRFLNAVEMADSFDFSDDDCSEWMSTSQGSSSSTATTTVLETHGDGPNLWSLMDYDNHEPEIGSESMVSHLLSALLYLDQTQTLDRIKQQCRDNKVMVKTRGDIDEMLRHVSTCFFTFTLISPRLSIVWYSKNYSVLSNAKC